MSDSDMAKRIKELRLSLGLTLEEVANQVGVGKSTVRKWETGIIANMKRDKIASLAKALHTTPGYLMGWTDINKVSASQNNAINLTTHEKELVLAYRSQPDTQPFVDKLLGIDDDSEYIELVARGGTYRVKKTDAVEWAKSLNLDDYEEDHDLG